MATDPLLPVTYTVASRLSETTDAVTVELAPIGDPIAPPLAGQFAMLWAPGIGEVPISFSAIAGQRLVHTIRAVGPVTRALCRDSDVVGVRGPFGNGWPAAGDDLLLVAGGIGLAPLRPVVREVLSRRSAFGRVSLVIGARTAHDLLFAAELAGWWREGAIEVRTTVDRACSHWRTGAVGPVTRELQRIDIDAPRTTALLCGPEVMMRIVAEALLDRGLPPGSVQLSLERSMQCGSGTCGHCQLGGLLICRDGPVFGYDRVRRLLEVPQR